jgi:hypothetical protein
MLSWERPEQLARLYRQIRFSDASTISLASIWTLNYMPRDLDISGVDLSEGERRIGDGGETMREMISNSYRCPVAS